MALTPKQERFVQEYLIDLNGKQAAIRSGYAEGSAEVAASRLLSNDKVRAAVDEAMEKRSARTEITQDMVLAELGKIAFADIRKAVRWGASPIDTESENADPNGLGIFPVTLIPSELIDDDIAAAVSEVSLTQTGIKIKMYDKRAALVDVGKHLGMFVDRHEHSGKDGAPLSPITMNFGNLSDAALAELMAARNAASNK